MIEPKFTLFEMQKEVLGTNAAAFGESRFRRAPRALDPVDVNAAAADEDTVAMFDAEMFPIPEVDQAVVANPAVGMNDAGQGDAPPNNGPQCCLFRVRDDLGIDAALALEDAKHDRLPARPAAAFAADAAPAKVGFIDFDGAGPVITDG